MGINNALPFPVGSYATQCDASLVGKVFIASDGRKVRLCKATTAIATPAGKAALYTVTGDVASYAKVTVADEVNAVTVAGIIDPALTATVPTNGYFWVYCGKGDLVNAIGAAAIATGLLVGTTTTGGGGRVASIGAAATAITGAKLMAAIGITTGAATAAADTFQVRLLGPV